MHLTKREIETARWVAAGQCGKEIAFTMGISTHTVKQYSKSLHRKLAVRNQAELIMRMIALGHIAVPKDSFMKLVNERLLAALKKQEVTVTDSGRITAQEGLFWGNYSVEEALGSGYVELNDKRQAEEDAHCDEFKKLIGQ